MSRRSSVTILAASFLALSGCASSPGDRTEAVDRSASPIIAGSADDADGAVVWIVAELEGRAGYCSGVVVSPHVVLTAGHCSRPNATFKIFLGSDYNDTTEKAKAENYVAVVAHHASPKYNSTRNTHDVGVLVTEEEIPRMPAKINRDVFTDEDRGQPIRIVGFGQTSADDDTIGRRYQATTKLDDYDLFDLSMTGTPSFCLFDSGGPTFMKRGGVEVVVGVHSIIDSRSCDSTASDARVDIDADFVDEQIAKADPPPDPAEEVDGGDAGHADPAPPPSSPEATGCSMTRPSRASGGALAVLFGLALGVRRSHRPRRRC